MTGEFVAGGLPLWLVITVVLVALTVGVASIGAVVRKYFADKWFHALGGPMLTGAGVILIGLSVYGNVTLKVGEFEAEFKRLRAEVGSLQSSLREGRIHAASLSEDLWATSGELRALSLEVEQASVDVTNAKLRAALASVKKRLLTLNEKLLPVVAAREEEARKEIGIIR